MERAPCVCVCVRARGVRVSGVCLTEGGGREASPPGAVGPCVLGSVLGLNRHGDVQLQGHRFGPRW